MGIFEIQKEDFSWIKKPVILTLESDTVHFCADVLKNRRKHFNY